ncbi:proline/betaine transporter [Burkholderia pseudomallei MSHR1043]|nr:proline/betaine transporter [Burkholderia pseudomallei MSHR1043]
MLLCRFFQQSTPVIYFGHQTVRPRAATGRPEFRSQESAPSGSFFRFDALEGHSTGRVRHAMRRFADRPHAAVFSHECKRATTLGAAPIGFRYGLSVSCALSRSRPTSSDRERHSRQTVANRAPSRGSAAVTGVFDLDCNTRPLQFVQRAHRRRASRRCARDHRRRSGPAQARRRRDGARQRDGMVRLRRLQLHRRHARPGVLPVEQPVRAVARDVRHVRRRLPRAPARRDGVRAARRSHRPPARARDDDDHDGGRHVRDRPDPELRLDRPPRARAAPRRASRARLLDGRRVRRRGNLHRRVLDRQAPRLHGQLPRVRHADRLCDGRGRRRAADGFAVARRAAVVGLARAVPDRRPARPDRPVHPDEARGNARVQAAGRSARSAGQGRAEGAFPPTARAALARAAAVRRPRADLQRHRLHGAVVPAELSVVDAALRRGARPRADPDRDGADDADDARHGPPVGRRRPQAGDARRLRRALRARDSRAAPDPHRRDGARVRRPADPRRTAVVLHGRDAVGAAGALSDRDPLRRARDRLQRVGVAVRRHDAARRRVARRRDGQPDDARVLPDGRGRDRRDLGARAARERAPAAQGLAARRRVAPRGTRARARDQAPRGGRARRQRLPVGRGVARVRFGRRDAAV